jgi:hypothetical protein
MRLPSTRAFGLSLRSGFDLPGTWPQGGGDGLPEVRLELSPLGDMRELLGDGERSRVWETTFPDGNDVIVERAANGAYRFVYGAVAEYVLSSEGDRILCATERLDDLRWQRFLLDTILWWTSLVHGYHVLHASAIEGPDGVVVFASQTGGGKTTLALEMLGRGWNLFSDDIVVMEPTGGRPVLHPGPPLMNAPSARPEIHTLGSSVAPLDDEIWLSVNRVAGGPRDLAAVFLYSRGPERQLAIDDAIPTVLDLVPHIWDIHVGDRLRDRFNLLANIIDCVPVYHLSAHSVTPPAEIADLVTALIPAASRQS